MMVFIDVTSEIWTNILFSIDTWIISVGNELCDLEYFTLDTLGFFLLIFYSINCFTHVPDGMVYLA